MPQLKEPQAAETAGIGLCLSGGGYRAMLFHVGAVWRLHEASLLFDLARISSVSGGSITAAVLALAFERLKQGQGSLNELFVQPVRRLASRTIDQGSIAAGLLLPGSVADYLVRAYEKELFGDRTLQDLPDGPKFIFNATNLETGSLFRFSKAYARDYRVGGIDRPTIRIAEAVAASSAFPPILSPLILDVEPDDFNQRASGVDDSFRRNISLADGGVYDNLGLENIWKNCSTVLVSDGGARIADDASPAADWASQSKRILEVIDHQVRSLRKRQLIASFVERKRSGAYWGIRTNIKDYAVNGALACPLEATRSLSEISTRLKRLPDLTQEKLINWGYAVCDAALRRHVDPALNAPANFPYPAAKV